MHLQSGLTLAADAGSRIGYADFVAGATITGWAINTLAVFEPVVLHAMIDGGPAGEIRCTLRRDDIRAAGIPSDIGGFRYRIPPDFMDGRPHVLRLELPGGAPISFPDRDGMLLPQHGFRIAATDAEAGCTDLSDLLREHGITSTGFVPLFDVADYTALNAGARLLTTAQCLGHFARTGRAALCPIAVPWRFDPEFYREVAPATGRLAPERAYLHWLNEGLEGGLSPNRSAFLKALGLTHLEGMPPGFDPALYLAVNPDVADSCAGPWHALAHAVRHGIQEERPGCPPPEGHADLYLAAADTLAVADRLADARRLYERVLAHEPAHPAGLQHYADCLLRMGDSFGAEQAYLRVLAAGAGNVWTDLNLAKCRRRTGRIDAAARGLAALQARMPGEVAVAREAREAAAACFDERRGQARQLAAHGFLAEGRARMAQAADIIVQPVRERLPDVSRARRPIRSVAIVADLVLPQCRFYRVMQKCEQAKAAGLQVQVFDQIGELGGFAMALPFLDAVIFYRVAATPATVAAIEAARAAGIPTFYDVDDLIFDPEHFPDSLASYGGQISAESYGDLVTGTELFRAALSLCDFALASTPALAARMQPHVRSGQAFVHRNGLGEAHLRQMHRPRPAPGDGVVRIFYGTGTKAGNEDFELHAAPALDRILRAAGDTVELVLMGPLSLPRCLARHATRIRRLDPVWDLDSYWSVLSCMDINLAVLKDTPLSDCKSEIKWLEAAMFAIPSVVSPTATYREVVRDGVDGMLAADAEHWFRALDRLVHDAPFRRAMGETARARVAKAYGPESLADNLSRVMHAVETPLARPAAAREKFRVLIVNVFFPPQDIGGATRVVADNVRDLLRAHGDALEIEIFATTEGGATPYAMHTYWWDGARVTAATAGSGGRPDWEPDDPQMGALFGQVLDRFRPDLVHFHCIQRLTGSVCRETQARDIPYVVTVHDGWWISDHQFLLDDALQLSTYRHADPVGQLERGGAEAFRRMTALLGHLREARAVLAVSEPFAELHRRCGLTNVAVVANGVPGFPFVPRVPAGDGRVRLAHIGGAAPHKGYNLLRAVLTAHRFRHLALTVIDHALQPGMEVSDLWGTVPVQFRARVKQAEIGGVYAATDVLIAPSVWPESFGLVTREALLAGCWVIASDRGALAADVTPDNGFVVDVGSSTALRDVLLHIDAEPDRYCSPPPAPPGLRHARAQAEELFALYLGQTKAVTRPPARRRRTREAIG